MISNIYMPTRVICGKGALSDNYSILNTLGSRCLILTGGSSAVKSGALSDAKAALDKAGIPFTVFDKIGPNPLISVCHKAGEAVREAGADFILGIGGGSVLDSAKAVAIYAANPSLSPIDIYKRAYDNAPLRVALAGTTSGTGSEVTGVSVLTNDETGVKKSISGPDCYAAVSFCDYTYTCSMPYAVTVSTALDAFAHAVEGWFTPKADRFIDILAGKAIPMIFSGLCELYETRAVPGENLREQLYSGSIYAGLIINTCGTGFPHPLGYVLTENFGVPHGAACAAFFPAFFDRALKFAPEKAAGLCSLCGAEADTVIEVITALAANKIKISPAEAEEYSKRWSNSVPKNFTASPGGLSAEEAADILASL